MNLNEERVVGNVRGTGGVVMKVEMRKKREKTSYSELINRTMANKPKTMPRQCLP